MDTNTFNRLSRILPVTLIIASGTVFADAEIHDESQFPSGPLTTITRGFTDSSTILNANVFGVPTDITCSLTLTSVVEVDSSGTSGSITITGGEMSGGFLCGLVGLEFQSDGADDWVATFDESALGSINNPVRDVPITFQGVSISLCGSGLAVPAVFNNNGNGTPLSEDSTISIAAWPGSCFLTTTLTQNGDDIDIVTNP